MKLRRHILEITAVAAACSLGLIEAHAASTDSPNPARSQQEIMKERYAACRDLHGSALKECMADYVGKPAKNLDQDADAQNASSAKPSTYPPPTDAAQQGTPAK